MTSASDHFKMGDKHLIKREFKEAIESYRAAISSSKTMYCDAWLRLSAAYKHVNDKDNSTKAMQVVIKHYEGNLTSQKLGDVLPDRHDRAASLHNLGLMYWQVGKLDEAILRMQQSVEMMKKALDCPKQSLVTALNNISNVYRLKTEFDKEIECRSELITLLKTANQNQIEEALQYYNLGAYCLQIERYQEAIQYCAKAIEIVKYLKQPILEVFFQQNMCMIYRTSKQYSEEIINRKKVLVIMDCLHKEDHFDKVAALNNLAVAYFSDSNYIEALKYQEACVKMMNNIKGMPLDLVSLLLYNLADDYYAVGQYDKALSASPNHIPSHHAKYQLLMGESRSQEALMHLNQVVLILGRDDFHKLIKEGKINEVAQQLDIIYESSPYKNLSGNKLCSLSPETLAALPQKPKFDIDRLNYLPDSDSSDAISDGMSVDIPSEMTLEKSETWHESNVDLFKALDEYGSSNLSEMLELKKFQDIRDALVLQDLTDVELLHRLANDMNDERYKGSLQIDQVIAKRISVEATDQLSIMGEDISGIVASYSWH